jgi:hypothetical protein
VIAIDGQTLEKYCLHLLSGCPVYSVLEEDCNSLSFCTLAFQTSCLPKDLDSEKPLLLHLFDLSRTNVESRFCYVQEIILKLVNQLQHIIYRTLCDV